MSSVASCSLENLKVENTFTSELPGDPSDVNQPRQVNGSLWSPVEPTPVSTEPKLVAASRDVCALLGLDAAETERPEFPLIFSGCAPLPGGKSYAQCYGGHQFGNWAGQLGDGRAISLGEVVHEGQRWELQLKGAGRTPYSRFADGRAVLRSSVREYVASEALHFLGVPTTRALSLVATGDEVARDMFYNGDVKEEPGAVVCRVSPSFVRFGTFQLPVSRGESEAHLTRQAADYVIKHHYPHLEGQPEAYLQLLKEVVQRTAELVSKWQLIGFVHGVLNTDNMSILGLTIDYGPYGFLDKFDPSWTPNLTDAQGRRYCYKNQIPVVQWNLAQLATAWIVADLISKEEAQEAIDGYVDQVMTLHNDGMAAKVGLGSYDEDVVTEFLTLMYLSEADFTNTFRNLAKASHQEAPTEMPSVLEALLGKDLDSELTERWGKWFTAWAATLKSEGISDEDRAARQNSVNPAYIPRQHILQIAIEAAEKGDYSELEALMDALRTPYEEQAGYERFSETPPPEMVRPGICMLSCSS